MNRTLAFLAVLAGCAGAALVADRSFAQTPPPAGTPAPAPTARAGGKIAVFNVAKVMRDYKRWQHYAALMNKKRMDEAGRLGKMRADVAKLQDDIQKESSQVKKDELGRQMLAKQREFEDAERTVRAALDKESTDYLKNLFSEINQCVKAIADSNGFDVVFAYPDAVTEEEKASPIYFDLKMRPPAAMPFFVSPSADMSEVLVLTLNKHFPPPADVLQTGGPGPAPAPAAPIPPK